MSREKNMTAQQKLGQLIERRAIDQFDEVFADNVHDHDPAPDQGPGVQGFKDFWTQFLTAFPDLVLTPETMVADDENVAVVLTVTGTHRGPFQGVEPTGKRFTVRGIQVARFDDGKIVERWGATDEAGILEQLGAS
ncbi:steroid delta-isomerase-like uncharacterized protein [Arthrobacter sp. CAN_A6]|uniref:ester cyclase n=1 Tax=Arthrobacter sp. CAN_A6 TaxID=2787721 RepID=UPI0018CA697E